jgi:hypothetical protein
MMLDGAASGCVSAPRSAASSPAAWGTRLLSIDALPYFTLAYHLQDEPARQVRHGPENSDATSRERSSSTGKQG